MRTRYTGFRVIGGARSWANKNLWTDYVLQISMHTTRFANTSGMQGTPLSHQGLFRTPAVLEIVITFCTPGTWFLEQTWEGKLAGFEPRLLSGVTLARSFRLSGLPWWLSGKESAWNPLERWVRSLGQENPLEKGWSAGWGFISSCARPEVLIFQLSVDCAHFVPFSTWRPERRHLV